VSYDESPSFGIYRYVEAHQLGTTTWPDVHDRAPRPVVAVPIGSCEQHGPHLPLDTDTRIAVALCEALAASFDEGDVLIAPPITISASGEHGSFPGTLSIGTDVMRQVLVELVRSADWSGGVVFVNGHGGNADAVTGAVRVLHGEHRNVLAWWPRLTDADAHAGHTETSMMLALAPHLVHGGRVEVGCTSPLRDIEDELRRGGVRSVSSNGVLGDPRHATGRHGRALLTKLTIDLVAAVDEWR
jgi:mycofactocin precursor peptide peptidase